MAEFSATVYQNEFLPDGGTDVNAIVTITCSGAGSAGKTGAGDAGEIIIVDTSGSMGRSKLEAAKTAASAAIDQILDGTWFAVVAGTHQAYLAYPPVRTGTGMVRMEPRARFEAHQAISLFRSDGGTAMGTWLTLAGRLFDSVPMLAQRHAILLTDGENHNETPDQLNTAIRGVTGKFQCDCRGVGVDWQVAEVRRIAQSMLGTVDIIPSVEEMGQVFAELMQQSMSRGVPDAQLRVWSPQGAEVMFVRQVSPSVEDLSSRRVAVNPLTGSYPTGSWGDESRDYHVSVRLSPQAIQDGLAAKAAGDVDTATVKLGRAVQLAAETGNNEATAKLRKVVDIDNVETGTVRLKRAVDKADEMALDTASTKTTRIRS